MAISGCIKVLLGVGTVFFGVGSLASLKDLRHASAPVWMQKLRMLLGGRFENSEYDQSACHACLASGKDFCIAGNRCIERATYQCQGPYDHITGDKEFALHGNPFTEHSMECPAPTHDPDCYFDKDCHAKVDWNKVKKIKGDFFARLKIMKEKKDVKAVRVMLGRVHNVFLKAGMPDDRIDDFLKKWVTSVYPEAFPVDDKNNAPDSKDCFFDEECHSKVDWDYVTEIKGGFLSRLKIMKEKRDVNDAKEMLGTVRKMCLEAGMPDDRIDYILTKWAKSILPDVLPLDSNIKSPDRKDCYFDKDCHAKVDWGSVSKVKRGFFKRLKYMKGQKRVGYAKHMLSKVHGLLLGAGMPDDRINYTIDEWMKYACPEAWDGLAEKRVETSSSPSIVV